MGVRHERRQCRCLTPVAAEGAALAGVLSGQIDRIEALWEAREDLGLSDEQARVLMLTRRGFVRAGAQLEGEESDRLKAVKEACASDGQKGAKKLMKKVVKMSKKAGDEKTCLDCHKDLKSWARTKNAVSDLKKYIK